MKLTTKQFATLRELMQRTTADGKKSVSGYCLHGGVLHSLEKRGLIKQSFLALTMAADWHITEEGLKLIAAGADSVVIQDQAKAALAKLHDTAAEARAESIRRTAERLGRELFEKQSK